MGDLKDKTRKGFAWKTIHTFATTGIQFFFMIFMTRLLSPSDYGMIGMLAVFIAFANAFVECGFGQALIRRQNRTSLDESTVFYFNIAASIICYFFLFCCSPLISRFYNMPVLSDILRMTGLTLVICSTYSVQSLLFSIKLDFKTQAAVNLTSVFVSGLVGLYLAYSGFGVWSLVWQQLLAAGINAIFYWVVSSWRPIWGFSVIAFKEMFSFGSKLLGSRLLNIVYANISTIFIGKYYTAADLGLYSKGNSIASFPSSTMFSVVSTVTYPTLCKLQSDRESLITVYRKFVRNSAYILFPIMTILAVVAVPLMRLLFGNSWTESGIYMSLACYPLMIVPTQCLNFNLLQVIGRSDLVLRLEIITKIMGVTMLAITLPISIYAMCYGTIINTTLCLILNIWYISKNFKIPIKDQFYDIIKSMMLSLLTGVVSFFAVMLIDADLLKIITGGFVGAFFYLFFSVVFRFKEIYELKDFIRKKNVVQ